MNRRELIWPTPEKGTAERPKVYEGRFLPDLKGNFYKKYCYHMFQVGEGNWYFIFCPKTHNFTDFCPWCSVVSHLYKGSAADKRAAGMYKRKERFVCNWHIIDDPRDSEREEEEKLNGKVRLYEFPGKVEAKLKEEVTDTKNGLGASIFDPGPDGYNFILKVLATKKDQNGKIWPDYSNSVFTRRPSSLGSDSEVNTIMSSTIDIDDYIKSLENDPEYIEKSLKESMVFDIVKEEWNRNMKPATIEEDTSLLGTPEAADDIDDSKWEKDDDVPWDENGNEVKDDGDLSDEDLMKELDSL